MTIYATATICGKWEWACHVPLSAELGAPKTQRSYLHYVAEHQDLVAAKCLATEWLLSGLTPGGSAVEYFGGAGIVSTIIKGLLAPLTHLASDIDARCVKQLQGLLGKDYAWQENAIDAMANTNTTYYLAVLDFPSFTALRIEPIWKKPWAKVFSTKPGMVVFTDTARSYLPTHKKTYEAFFSYPITDDHSYTVAFSQRLLKTQGYSIKKAAYRARNAAYYLCVPGESALEEASFPAKGSEHGFVLCCR